MKKTMLSCDFCSSAIPEKVYVSSRVSLNGVSTKLNFTLMDLDGDGLLDPDACKTCWAKLIRQAIAVAMEDAA